ncbi:protein phosphatase [Nitrospirillum amazonense]|uniref:Protein phosphatase n=1 Tax=Nitrospirillum amazonense TaxID=28077 RepID=A0A560FK58_9PROT|nr:PP2C family serine/threonine-protein phosphatase [Nitrospirillum amazonense]TWB21986.1 protein phosphatase [Nitrospirillum amazonense]
MKYIFAKYTDKGPRDRNEDYLDVGFLKDSSLVVAIADGLGGHFGGEIASSLAVKVFFDKVAENSEENFSKIGEEIHECIISSQNDEKRRGMATTLIASVFCERKLRGIHCGDSRLVVVRENGIKRLTEDHTEAQRLFKYKVITKHEYNNYRRKNILESALGMRGNPRIDEINFTVNPDDVFIYTTDGVHEKIFLKEMFHMVRSCVNPRQFVDMIVREIKLRGASDNFSIICIFAKE